MTIHVRRLPAYLYVMDCASGCKIGVSYSPSRRADQLNYQRPHMNFVPVFALKFKERWDAFLAERVVRSFFKPFAVDGREIFDMPSLNAIEFIADNLVSRAAQDAESEDQS